MSMSSSVLTEMTARNFLSKKLEKRAAKVGRAFLSELRSVRK